MLLNAAVLPPALLIGDESTLALSRTNTHQESRAGRKGRLKIVPSGWPAIVLLVMAVFLLLRVYRQQGPAPTPAANTSEKCLLQRRCVFLSASLETLPCGSPGFTWR